MRLVRVIGDRLPKGWGDAARQVGLFVLADLCYETVRGIAEGKAAEAFSNARLDRRRRERTGTFFEPDLQAGLMCQHWLIDVANFMYVNSHFVITTAFLVWLYLRHNDSFYFVRNMFMVAMGLALVGYTLFPTAPPRFFPELGFVDTIAYYVNVKHDSGARDGLLQPVRRRAEHARRVRAADRGAGDADRRATWCRRCSGPPTRCSSPSSSS